jgi:hypothetical protein
MKTAKPNCVQILTFGVASSWRTTAARRKTAPASAPTPRARLLELVILQASDEEAAERAEVNRHFRLRLRLILLLRFRLSAWESSFDTHLCMLGRIRQCAPEGNLEAFLYQRSWILVAFEWGDTSLSTCVDEFQI